MLRPLGAFGLDSFVRSFPITRCVCLLCLFVPFSLVTLQEEGNGVLELTWPETVAGVRMHVKAALFGPPLASCTRKVQFALAQPLMCCKEQEVRELSHNESDDGQSPLRYVYHMPGICWWCALGNNMWTLNVV